jgi:predicted RNA-binding Zn-ribbon protein involved in translation (DUF1610 family)
MNEYIKKEELISIIQALPVAEFNGVDMCSKKRVLKAIEVLPISKIFTKVRRNRFSQVYCQSCNQIINLPCWEVEHLGNCPHCGLEIEECIF